MRTIGLVILLGALPVFLASGAEAFSSFADQGGNVHEQITREGLGGTISDINLNFIVKAVISQDAPGGGGFKERRRHFEDANIGASLAYIDRIKRMALNYAANSDTDAEDRAQALRHFGLMLHTAQDFYSRTNYVELQLEDPVKKADPYNIELVDWARVPDGYAGKRTGMLLRAGGDSVSDAGAGAASAAPAGGEAVDWNKDNPGTPEGKKAVGSTTYFKVARDLAVRETQRQWNLFETLIRGRYHARAAAIIAALKQASPAPDVAPDAEPD